jgi:hypothetical protein
MPKKIDNETFITRAKKIHGDKYDYSCVEYIHSEEKVKIFCKFCNIFWMQKAKFHLMGYNHKKCTNYKLNFSRRITKQDFLKKAKKKYNNNFSYEESTYVDYSKTKIKISCNTCNNVFYQKPSKHLESDTKIACKVCSDASKRVPINKFIERAKKIHGEKFDYAHTDYKNNFTKIKIYCIKGQHFFYQTPTNHVFRKSGCQQCKNNFLIK